jgi:hypothetical protein
VPTVRVPSDWGPLAQFVAVDHFERVGTFLERQERPQYTEMLTQWASAISSFETTVRRISELPRLVYYEIEERHFHHAFDDHGMIEHLDVYLQAASGTDEVGAGGVSHRSWTVTYRWERDRGRRVVLRSTPSSVRPSAFAQRRLSWSTASSNLYAR